MKKHDSLTENFQIKNRGFKEKHHQLLQKKNVINDVKKYSH